MRKNNQKALEALERFEDKLIRASFNLMLANSLQKGEK